MSQCPGSPVSHGFFLASGAVAAARASAICCAGTRENTSARSPSFCSACRASTLSTSSSLSLAFDLSMTAWLRPALSRNQLKSSFSFFVSAAVDLAEDAGIVVFRASATSVSAGGPPA